MAVGYPLQKSWQRLGLASPLSSFPIFQFHFLFLFSSSTINLYQLVHRAHSFSSHQPNLGTFLSLSLPLLFWNSIGGRDRKIPYQHISTHSHNLHTKKSTLGKGVVPYFFFLAHRFLSQTNCLSCSAHCSTCIRPLH